MRKKIAQRTKPPKDTAKFWFWVVQVQSDATKLLLQTNPHKSPNTGFKQRSLTRTPDLVLPTSNTQCTPAPRRPKQHNITHLQVEIALPLPKRRWQMMRCGKAQFRLQGGPTTHRTVLDPCENTRNIANKTKTCNTMVEHPTASLTCAANKQPTNCCFTTLKH